LTDQLKGILESRI